MPSADLMLFDYDPLDPAHKASFAALNREWLVRYFRVEAHDEANFADPRATVLAKGGVILMAAAEGRIVGTGSLFALEPGVYEIAKMAVTESHQARGIGEALVLALIERARALGGSKLFIVSNTSLERAIRLYRRHGFTGSPEVRHAHYERGNITLERTL